MDEDKTINNKILGILTFIILLFVSFICFVFIGICRVDAQDLYWVRPRNNAITNYVDPMAGSVISTTDSQVVGTLNNFTNNGNRLSPRFRVNQNIVDSSITYLPNNTHYKIVLKGTFQVINSTTPNLSNAIRIYASTQENYISAYCDGTSSLETTKLSDSTNRYNYTYTCTDFLVDRTDISFLAIVIHSSNVNFNYNYISSLSLYDITNEKDNESIINNQDKNTEEIINNQNQNANDIMNNQDKNTQDITNKLDEVDDTNKGILDTIRSFFGDFFGNLINGITSIFLPDNFDFLDGFLDTLENKLGFIASIPIQILEFLIDLVTYEFDNMTSITLPDFSVLDYDLWDAQEIDLTEIINTFEPYRIYTNIACVSLCAYYLMKLYENFASGGGN